MSSETPTPKLSILDFGPDPIFSDPFEITIKGRTLLAVFAELSQRQKDRLKIQALMEVQAQRSKAEEDAGGQFGDWAAEFFESAVNNAWYALVLLNAIRDHEEKARPLLTREVFELIPTGTVVELCARYEQFESGLSVATVTSEKIQEFIEAVKKNMTPSDLWRRFGTSILWGSLLFLVDQLSTSQTEASSDT